MSESDIENHKVAMAAEQSMSDRLELAEKRFEHRFQAACAAMTGFCSQANFNKTDVHIAVEFADALIAELAKEKK